MTRRYGADDPRLAGLVRGAVRVEAQGGALVVARLPEDAFGWGPDEGLRRGSEQLSGVSLVARTDATWLRLDLLVTRWRRAIGPSYFRPAPFSLEVDGVEVGTAEVDAGDTVWIDTEAGRIPGDPASVRFALPGSGRRVVRVRFPPAAGVRLLAVEADAELAPAESPSVRWTHYGSSISHGSLVAPGEPWPVRAAAELGWEVLNLGLAGEAMLDPSVARVIATHPADVLSVKVGINPVNHAGFTERTFEPAVHAFLDTIRAGHPETPLVLVSPVACPIHEDTPGPTRTEPDGMRYPSPDADILGGLTLRGVRRILERVVARRADPRLRYLDGLELLHLDEEELLFDRLHPDAEGLRRIAERFAARARTWSITPHH